MKRLAAFAVLLVVLAATIGAALSSGTTSVSAVEFRCDIAKKFICTEAAGCRAIETTVWNRIDTDRRTYARCDRKGCDTHPAQFKASGVYIYIDVPERGMIAKMTRDGSSFLEVTTLAGQVYTSFGSCRAGKNQ